MQQLVDKVSVDSFFFLYLSCCYLCVCVCEMIYI